MLITFPAVRAALAKRNLACEACRGLGVQPGIGRPAERAEWQRLHDAATTAYDEVRNAYAREMLPAILGGIWRRTEQQLWIGKRIWVAGGLCRTLLDHPLHFRRLDAPAGKLTRRNCALLGQPYPSVLTADAREDVALLAALGFAAWHRDDLSAWYPGWTELVLVAAALDPDDAAHFGFTALRVAEHPEPAA